MTVFDKDTMLLFDLDGTLWDSSKEVAESWNIILEKYVPESANLTAGDIRAVMGRTMTEIAEMSLPDMEREKKYRVFDECQNFEIDYIKEHGGMLFPAVREVLEQLLDVGFCMAIVSNCQTGYINAFLQSMKMSKYFKDYEEWGNTLKSKAENIRLVMERNHFAKAVYIGDTIKDYEAARDAEIPFIHAAYGFGKIEEAKHVIQDFPGLLTYLR